VVAAIQQPEVRRVGPILRTLLIGLVVAVGGAAALAGLETVDASASLAAPVVYVVGATLLFAHWGSGSRFGAANTVTLTRLIGTSWLAALATAAVIDGLGRPAQIAVVVVGTTCLLLDGVDGRSLAQTCADERSQIGRDAFDQKYGTPKSKYRNAFGKCVSQNAKS